MGTQTVRTSTVRNLGPVSDYPAHAGETEAAALHRLAAQAKAGGIKIIQNIVTNAHFATSASRPGTLHKVTLYSCDCAAFLRWRRCTHFAAVLEMYHSLPPIVADTGPDSGPDGGGVALPVPTWTVAHEPDGERPPFVVRYAGVDVVDRPVRRFWCEPAARTEAELLNRAAARERELARDVVVSIVPAPQPRHGPTRVENPHTVTKPSPWNSRETMDFYYADAVEIDGHMHRVGDLVRYAYRKGELMTMVGTIAVIYRTTATGRRWKVTFRENGFGRSVADVRALAVEEVRHAA